MATANWYGLALSGQFSATSARRVDWVTDTIKAALVTSAYTPNQDTHDFWDDVSANELASGGGYTTGGVAVTSKSVTYDSTSNEARLIGTIPTWTFVGTKTFLYCVLYSDTAGASSTDPLLAYQNLGAQSITDTTFTITADATGLLKVAAA